MSVNSAQPVVESDLFSMKGSGEEEEDNNSSGHPKRPQSPEAPQCAICLSDLVNPSRSNNCAHQFCYGCLQQWSKEKPECPLCKSSFRSIYHNYRSTTDYDEYVVPRANDRMEAMKGYSRLILIEVISLSEEEQSRIASIRVQGGRVVTPPTSRPEPADEMVLLDSSPLVGNEIQPDVVGSVEELSRGGTSAHPANSRQLFSSNASSSSSPASPTPRSPPPASSRTCTATTIPITNSSFPTDEHRYGRSLPRDPRMPRPEVETNVSQRISCAFTGVRSGLTIDRSRATAATTTTVTNNFNHNRSSSSSPVNLQAGIPPSVVSNGSGAGNSRNELLSVVDVESPPNVDIGPNISSERNLSYQRESARRPLSSQDLPIFTLRPSVLDRGQERSTNERNHDTFSRIARGTRSPQEFMEEHVNFQCHASSSSRGELQPSSRSSSSSSSSSADLQKCFKRPRTEVNGTDSKDEDED